MMNTSEAQWRPMTAADVPAVIDIAARVHLSYPEDDAVFFERPQLYPDGCKVLERDGKVVGYVLSHPWHYLAPPALNARLGSLPEVPDTYYIHDVALLPEARGADAGSTVVRTLIAHAATTGVGNLSLVAVPGTPPFWARHGFTAVSDPRVDAKLKSYDDEARYMARPL
jgi:ribosomal protein S18 acetylase RimI-like enzyme